MFVALDAFWRGWGLCDVISVTVEWEGLGGAAGGRR